MSANKAVYPERPPKFRFKKPGKGHNKPSSEKRSSKGRTWTERAEAPTGVYREKLKEAKLNSGLCSFGHSAAVSFLKKYSLNGVPQHFWGKKGRSMEKPN